MKKYLIAVLMLFCCAVINAQTPAAQTKAESFVVNFINAAEVSDGERARVKEFVEKTLNAAPYDMLVLAGAKPDNLTEQRLKNVETYLLILGVDKSKINYYIDANTKPQKSSNVEIWVYR